MDDFIQRMKREYATGVEIGEKLRNPSMNNAGSMQQEGISTLPQNIRDQMNPIS